MAAFSFVCIQAQAQDWQSAIVIEKTDGTNLCIYLSDKPELEYGASTIDIVSDAMQTSLERKLVRKCYFADEAVSIDEVTSDNGNKKDFVFKYTDGKTVELNGETNIARVYTIDGRKLSVPCTVTGGKTIIDLGSLPQGTYVITVNDGQSFKVTRR